MTMGIRSPEPDSVSVESPQQAEIAQLINDLDAYQDSLYPAEARYALDMNALIQANVRFVVARDEQGAAVGCGALVLFRDYGELKRMYVRPERRGTGVADNIIEQLECQARQAGKHTLMLETGPYQTEALRFYAKKGYARRNAFGTYPEHPLSVFMQKTLPPIQGDETSDGASRL